MQKWLLLAFLIFFSVASASAGSETGRQEQALRKITFSTGTTIQAEVADTEAKRQLGLMFRKSLPQDRAMLFIFDRPDLYYFWMKNCLFPIDMVWLDQKKRIVNVTSNVPPCLSDPCPTYQPASKALYVIETVGGFANENGL
ncbi:MAG TPA: DUF192 domain-containing protein, partial [Nitrospiria bacterium]|nr:DUF192 domain-containing protein [Nitrospiria bacterium]